MQIAYLASARQDVVAQSAKLVVRVQEADKNPPHLVEGNRITPR